MAATVIRLVSNSIMLPSTKQVMSIPWLLQAKVQEGDSALGRLQTTLQNQQVHNNQLQNTLQATEAELQEANALTDAEHLQVTLLQEAAAAREAAVQLLGQQLQDTEDKLQQQGQQLKVNTILMMWNSLFAVRICSLFMSHSLARSVCRCSVSTVMLRHNAQSFVLQLQAGQQQIAVCTAGNSVHY